MNRNGAGHALTVIILCGCNSQSSPPPAPPPSSKTVEEPMSNDRPYEGPPVTVVLLQQPTHPAKNVVSIMVTAPSGGWALTFDKGEVANQTARVFLTLERPAEGEAVTRALVDHQAGYTTTETFDKAEVHIHLAQRGVSTLTTDYRLAKTANVDDPNDSPPPAGESSPPGAAAGHSGSSSPGSGPGGTVEKQGYAGPLVTVQIVQAKRLPPISTAMIEVTAPTGGWTLALDLAEIVDGTAKIYLTLERPAEGEMVTQSLVTLKERYTSESPPFFKAEVYAHLAQRGVHTLTTNYRLAAKQD